MEVTSHQTAPRKTLCQSATQGTLKVSHDDVWPEPGDQLPQLEEGGIVEGLGFSCHENVKQRNVARQVPGDIYFAKDCHFLVEAPCAARLKGAVHKQLSELRSVRDHVGGVADERDVFTNLNFPFVQTCKLLTCQDRLK